MKLNVYLYKTPGVHKKIAEGILFGADHFIKTKLKLNPVYKQGSWNNVQKKGNHFNLFLTNNALTQSKINHGKYLEGNVIFKTRDLNDFRNYKDKELSIEHLRRLRGVIAGYNEMARILNIDCCNEHHCVFNFEKRELDTLAFLLHLNKKMPICRKHKEWKLS